jgi:hypothetical protein
MVQNLGALGGSKKTLGALRWFRNPLVSSHGSKKNLRCPLVVQKPFGSSENPLKFQVPIVLLMPGQTVVGQRLQERIGIKFFHIFHTYGLPTQSSGGDIDVCNYLFIGDFVDRGTYSLEVRLLPLLSENRVCLGLFSWLLGLEKLLVGFVLKHLLRFPIVCLRLILGSR